MAEGRTSFVNNMSKRPKLSGARGRKESKEDEEKWEKERALGSSVDDVPEGNQSTDDPTLDKAKRNKVPEDAASDSEDHLMESEEEVSLTNKQANSNQDKTQEAQPEQTQFSDDPEKQQKFLQDLKDVFSDLSKYSLQADLLKQCIDDSGISPVGLLDFFHRCEALHKDHGRKNSDRPGASSHKAKSSSSLGLGWLTATVKVFTVVTGQTFGAHDVILEKLSKSTAMEITRDWQDCDIIMIFCPITSRVGSDVEAAMRKIPDGKPAILLLMHHTRDVDYSTDTKRWSEKYPNIQLEVHALFHETLQGLLKCPRNDQAANKIQKVLKSYCKHRWRPF